MLFGLWRNERPNVTLSSSRVILDHAPIASSEARSSFLAIQALDFASGHHNRSRYEDEWFITTFAESLAKLRISDANAHHSLIKEAQCT